MNTRPDQAGSRPAPMGAAAATIALGASVLAPIATPLPRVTFEAWLDAGGEGPLTEWVDGEVIVHMAASVLHQRLVSFLDRLLGFFATIGGLGEVLIAPAAMRATPDGAGREPDLMFVAAHRREIVTDRWVEGPPDLVVEIVSDDSVARDRDEKYSEYEAAGIREYWIIDPRPNRRRADFFVLDDNGRYQPVPVGADAIYRSAVIDGFWLDPRWLWADEPDPVTALRQIVGAL